MDPAVCHGKPCVRGLRYPIETLLELLNSGMTIDDILVDYEDLERDDLLAVLAFAARLARTRRLYLVGPCTSSWMPSCRDQNGIPGRNAAGTTQPFALPALPCVT